MPDQRLNNLLSSELEVLRASGVHKADEMVITAMVPSQDGRAPRYLLQGEGKKQFLRMNSNNYLGMSLQEDVIAAEEKAVREFGVGPGAVRFISGTWLPHVNLERHLAEFHGREEAMIFSSAYAAVMGVLTPLITKDTVVISDELNHNSIINALRLSRPKEKLVYRHLVLEELETQLKLAAKTCRRAIIVSDGIFSMRGDHAPLAKITHLARQYDSSFEEGVLVVIDDSHGVGAFGATGRGTEEYTKCGGVDLLIATLGKAFGVNGGYVAGSHTLINYLREKAPFYIYSNPITPGEAAAAIAALNILDSPKGLDLLAHLRAMTAKFESGLIELGFETITGEHPIVPLMVRDTKRTASLVSHLKVDRILATGLNYPVVPKGEEEIRFQISADHNEADIEEALTILAKFK